MGIRGYLSAIGDNNFKLPILNNFSKGLNIFEYFISCLGARKGVADTAIKTADSGYLTQRLVDLTQEIVVKERYCGTKNFCYFTSYINSKGNFFIPHYLLIYGKNVKSNVLNIFTKEVIIPKNNYICPQTFNIIYNNKYNFYKLKLSSIKLCSLGRTLCSECLGISSTTTNFISTNIGMLVGQTVGEPSTQMTLRTFHTGGVYTPLSQFIGEKEDHTVKYRKFDKYKICSIQRNFNYSLSRIYKSSLSIFKKRQYYSSLLPFNSKQYLKSKKYR